MREHPYMDFCKLEKEMNLFELQIDSVYYWQLIRVYILKKITKHRQSTIDLSLKTPYLRRLRGNIVNALRQKKKSSHMQETDILTIRPHVAYPVDKNTKDREFDYASLKKSYRVTDIYVLGEYSIYNVNDFFDFSIPELSVIFWQIKRKLLGSKRIDLMHEKCIRSFINKINERYNCEISYADIEKNIDYRIHVFNKYKKYIKKVLVKTKPKLILVSTYYDDHIFPFFDMAKELGITTAELQHGIINSHEAYWYEDTSSIGKYLPDYLFTYGTWWNENIKMPDCVKVQAVGYPFLETQINYKKGSHSFVLAVFSGPQTGVVLSTFIVENISLLRKNGIHVIYKLHPVECSVWKREYPWLADCKEIQIVEDKANVYEVLNHADMALAVNSTVLFEATSYPNMKIGVYNKEYIGPMLPLIDCGAAMEISSIEELIDYIKTPCKQNNGPGNDMFFKNNAGEETNNFIKQLIGI